MFTASPLAAAAALVLVACGTPSRTESKTTEPESLAECDAYVAAHTACLTSLGAAGVKVAPEREAALRASFKLPSEPAQREALRKRCTEAVRQIQGSCR